MWPYLQLWSLGTRASVRYLKDHLSQCLLEVQRGTEIIVTSHRSPVAKLVPFSFQEEDAQETRETFFAELATLRLDLHKRVRGKPLSQTIVDMRNEERF